MEGYKTTPEKLLNGHVYGFEIETYGLSRKGCSWRFHNYLKSISEESEREYVGGMYDKYIVKTKIGKFEFMRDGSILHESTRGTEIVTPTLNGVDMLTALTWICNFAKKENLKSAHEFGCGIHMHISPKSKQNIMDNTINNFNGNDVLNIVRIMHAHEKNLKIALGTSSERDTWCQNMDDRLYNAVSELNSNEEYDISYVKELYYNAVTDGRLSDCSGHHYFNGRYVTTNLHSLWMEHGLEFRCGEMHGKIDICELWDMMMVYSAIVNYAITHPKCRFTECSDNNTKYQFRIFMKKLGMVGDEFKPVRQRLLSRCAGTSIKNK